MTGVRLGARWPLPSAFILGALSVLALAPVFAFPVLWATIPGLTALLAGRGILHAGAIGWGFGFGFHLGGLYWIANALLVDAARFGWLWPFAVILVPALLAVFAGLASASVAWIERRAEVDAITRMLLLALAWALFDWLRGGVLTGFPWNALGYVWSVSDVSMQAYAYLGVPAAGLVTFLAAGAPLALLSPRRRPLAAALLTAPALLLLAGAGLRLQNAVDPGVQANARLRLVQPNIAQQDKWNPALRDRHIETLLKLSAGPGYGEIDALIWPETAAPFVLAREAGRRRLLALLAPKGGALITGAVRTRRRTGEVNGIWNSIQAIDRRGEIIAQYDKHHLVPFGEYLPFRPLLSWFGLDKIVQGAGDFVAGGGPALLRVAALPPFRPLICYEAIFPSEVAAPARAAWLLNVTNDAWYGDSSGPRQHLVMAQARAVEQGVPLVRATNTGISAVTDAYGRIVARLELGQRGVLDVDLPQPLATAGLYGRYGDGLFALLWLILAAFAGWRLWREYRLRAPT